MSDPRFRRLKITAPIFVATTPVCIVDEDAGDIIAYAVSEEAARLILDALQGAS